MCGRDKLIAQCIGSLRENLNVIFFAYHYPCLLFLPSFLEYLILVDQILNEKITHGKSNISYNSGHSVFCSGGNL